MDSRTRHLGVRLNEVGSCMPAHLVNRWGDVLNTELRIIDEAVGAICTSEQVDAIKRTLYQVGRRGVIL